MPLFSAHYALVKTQPQLDFVDINTERDKQLFLDPYVFSKGEDIWSRRCHETILSFFEAVVRALRAGDDEVGRHLLDNLREPNETCLGLSRGRPSGRGVGRQQADQLFGRLRDSRAVETGLLAEISDCELFIPGFGPDKVSDVTTNIIRRHLIEYTQQQCELHSVPTIEGVASGMLWDGGAERWTNQYTALPVIDGRAVLLVPKSSVRWKLAFSHEKYYDEFVLTFLQAEHLDQHTALVETLQNGRRRVTKKILKERYPLSKPFLADYTDAHPEILRAYKGYLNPGGEPRDGDLDETFIESAFSRALIEEFGRIPAGNAAAGRYHAFMVGVLEFIFYPHLIYPIKENEIHEGRKRIDMSYTNNGQSGFFFRRRAEPRVSASEVHVECKNYQKDIANPELDQMSGRFSPRRGHLGFIMARSMDNRGLFVARCRDTARDNRGFIMLLVDEDVIQMLSFIADGRRDRVDAELERRYRELLQ